MSQLWKIAVLSGILVGFFGIQPATTCSTAVCGSIVSKCLLTRSCTCKSQTYKCRKKCSNCLGHLYKDCCVCVDMCSGEERREEGETVTTLGNKFRVGHLEDPVPGLFPVLTEYPDLRKPWDITSFQYKIYQYKPKEKIKGFMRNAKQELPFVNHKIITANCTVAFLSKCMSWTKCKSTCQTMGAHSYRWFNDGCCECVGEHCVNYGISESRCRKCPLKEEDEREDEYDYSFYI